MAARHLQLALCVCPAHRISAVEARRSCAPSDIPFETTAAAAELSAAGGVVGQDRAVEALRFGVGIRRKGYNVFAVGPSGVGKQTLLEQFLGDVATRQKPPSDWCYVHDFGDPERPRALELPAGMGSRLQRDMDRAVAELRLAMRSAFESEEHRTRKKQIVQQLKERQQRALGDVQERAKRRDVAVIETDSGIVLAPITDGSPIEPEKFEALPAEQQEKLRAEMVRVGGELQELLQSFHDWGRSQLEALKELDREMAATAARGVLDKVRQGYLELPAVIAHLAQVELDVVDSAEQFLEGEAEGVEAALRRALRRERSENGTFRRYRVNVLVDRSQLAGAPVVYEDNPTYANLVGRIEHEAQFGALVANFTLIRAGALHRAVGGYLILDADKVLRHPLAWEALKRAIKSTQIKLESFGQAIGLASGVSIEPAPIPLRDTKVVLCGARLLYYLLVELDPEFPELFKVLVDFDETMDRGGESQATYAQLLAALVRKEGLRPFDRGAIARVIEHAARAAGDAEKLSMQMNGIADLLRETDYWAGEASRAVAATDDVERAIGAQLARSGRIRRRLQEAVVREDQLVATSGETIGQVNGLSVLQAGEHRFGHPARITARVRLGKGEVIDIEREVELGGPIHSKGVLILAGFFGERYARRLPLSLSASLVFEQSYGSVEGDSASLAELCALLSALAEAPVRQSLAITGSVNQRGEAQAIGGVNEKIEGFFDLCRERGLTGEQGVLIPRSNLKNLMLRRDVVEAIESGQFNVYAVEHVDDAIELLTGTAAGAHTSGAGFPEGSINARVEARLGELADSQRAFLARSAPGS